MIDQILEDIKRTHITLNAEAGHGKSTALKTIIAELKRQQPKTIVKVFDVSQSWYHCAPLPHRQKITPPMLFDYLQGKPSFLNINDCVYEMGSLTEEMRRFFVAIIIREDYDSRRDSGYANGPDAVSDLPNIVYLFEEADTYFDSASLNKKDEASAILRDFIKVGRNFGLRAFCVVTAAVGELGTKLRRRTKYVIGKILSDEDLRFYNRKVKKVSSRVKNGVIKSFLDNYKEDEVPPTLEELEKEIKGLGDLSLRIPPFHWIYYNGAVSELFAIGDRVRSVPVDFEVPRGSPEQPEVEEGVSITIFPTWAKIIVAVISTFLLTLALSRL